MAKASDEDLMIQYQQGSAAAFDLLYLRYENGVYGYILRLIGDPEQAAELFQETFYNLHRHRQQYDPEKPFAPWLFRIARNLVYNERRRVVRNEKVIDNQVDIEIQADHGQDSQEERLQKQELKEQLDGALLALPNDQREALILSYYGGLKYVDIAEIMNASQDAIKQKVRRGLGKLRKVFQDVVGE